MEVLLLVAAAVIATLVLAGWLLLLLTPLLSLSAGAAGGLLLGGRQAHRALARAGRDVANGILCIDGLTGEQGIAARLRKDLVRVLALAPAGTRPRACACVKPVEGAFAGVLRVFNTQGHWLLRVKGDSVAGAAAAILSGLSACTEAFPARPGMKRERCPECEPRACPLRHRVRATACCV